MNICNSALDPAGVSPPLQIAPAALVQKYREHARGLSGSERTLIGICGPPGGGKSTFASWLVRQLNDGGAPIAAVLGQDGYHRQNQDLESAGLRHRKGRPETFDPTLFIRDLRRVGNSYGRAASTPIYSREIHDTIDCANEIPASARLIVVEGIFLLLDSSPWDELRDVLNEALYLSRSWHDCRRTLLQRQIRGKAPDSGSAGTPLWRAITGHVKNVDYENFKLVERSRHRASQVIRLTKWVQDS